MNAGGGFDFDAVYAAARAGGPRAFEVLWRELEPRVRHRVGRLLYADLRADWLLDEVVQQVSVDVVTQLACLPAALSRERLEAIVQKFARRRVVDAARRLRALARGAETPLEELAEEMSSMGRITLADALQRIRVLVGELPAPYARIIQLHDFDGEKLSDIAERLGLRYATARKQHQRALAMLLERTRTYREG